MSIGKLIGRGMFAALLAIGPAGGVFAASGHAHDQAAKSELTLNKGAKWQTDAALRQGMAALRGDLAAALPDIHHGRFTAAQYDALATRVEGHVEYLVTNCKLSPEADEQLHVVLGEVLDGAATMKGDAERTAGAVKILESLQAYAAHFDHPGWQPIGH